MILTVTCDWGFKPTPDQLAVMREYDPTADVYPDTEDQNQYTRGCLKKAITCDAEMLRDPRLAGIRFVIDVKPLTHDIWLSIQDQLSKMKERMDSYSVAVSEETATGQTFNTKCSVHVPGLGLMLMTEVTVEKDACTEYLQKMLDDGWRILAICPQPNQRRPDYVLGRSKQQ